MYGIQLGTARDISSVLDVLPSRLGIQIEKVGVMGVSLGGHTSLLGRQADPHFPHFEVNNATVLATDERFDVCCSIIGCPDYLSLMKSRAEQHNVDVEKDFEGFFSQSLQQLVR